MTECFFAFHGECYHVHHKGRGSKMDVMWEYQGVLHKMRGRGLGKLTTLLSIKGTTRGLTDG